ncbi:MAG: hypothetical protein E6G87_01490 [Alphaproteobacteria bacterium]|nr:MAG: hypothetical protein E6G87_01490 [Alphaproteobacteria bacterium]
MNWDFNIAPLLPWPALAALAAAGLVFIAVSVLTRGRGWILRGLALALLLAALVNPSLRNEDRELLSDIAIAVVDQSRSQSFGDRAARTERALGDLKQVVGRLSNTELRVVTVTSNVSAENDGTRLFTALNEALSEVPPERFAGAVFITDGQVHDVPKDADKLGLNAPLHGLITGSRKEIDRRIVIEQSPRFGIVGKEQTVRFRVEETGNQPGPIGVTIRLNNGEERNIEVQSGQSVSLPVLVDHGGQNITEIIADPLPGEITEQNNRAISIIEGIRDRLRVLLVSGEPHPGERTWRNLLKADASVDLVHFTILRPPEKQDGTPIKELSLIAFPTRELFVEKLDEFDLIIFDRYQRHGILPMMYLANIADYVKRGGAVLIAAGPDFAAEDGLYNTPLNAVLQVVPSGQVLEGGFKPQVTDRGQRHPVTRGLPGAEGKTPKWGRWFRLVDAQAESGEVVMSGLDNKPLLVLSREEQGRLALLLSDHGWLWARGYEGGGPQTELLRRLAHWLMKEPDLEEEYLSGKQDNDNIVIERRTMADTAAPVTVTLPSGATRQIELKQVTPGVWRAGLPVTEPGIHRLADGKLTAAVAIGSADPKETADPVATEAKLAPAAKASGGGLFWLEDYSNLPRIGKADAGRQMAGSGWLDFKANNAHRVRAVHELPLFSTLGSLALLLMGFAAMWYREGR